MSNPSDRQDRADQPGNRGPKAGESMRSERSCGFTPGPWRYVLDLGDAEVWGPQVNERDSSYIEIARCGQARRPENEANARLIAQAPEMFRLLDLIRNGGNPWGPMDESEHGYWERDDSVNAEIDRVLREVRGG